MGGEISRHNKRNLGGTEDAVAPTCNCRAALKHRCPLPNSCTISNVVFGATVTNEADNTVETYRGLTANPFKKRVRQHEADIEKYRPHDPGNHKSGTRLSRHCGQLAANNIPYTITWKILKETKTAFNPTTGFCVLCSMEKFLIMFKPGDATLNLRSEFFSHCRHKEQHLLGKS